MLAIALAKHLDDAVDDLVFHETIAGGNVFIGHMPDRPDAAVMIMPTGGEEQATLDPSDVATVQILVRGAKGDQRGSWTMAAAIYDALAGLDHTTLDPGGTDEVFVIGTTFAQSAPTGLGADEVGRPEWSLNVVVDHSAPTQHRPTT